MNIGFFVSHNNQRNRKNKKQGTTFRGYNEAQGDSSYKGRNNASGERKVPQPAKIATLRQSWCAAG